MVAIGCSTVKACRGLYMVSQALLSWLAVRTLAFRASLVIRILVRNFSF